MTEDSGKYLCDKVNRDFCEAPTIWTMWKRLPEFFTDPVSNQLSGSRFGVLAIGTVCCFVAVHETLAGRASVIVNLLIAVFASVAGIYFGSTVKDWRWRRDREDINKG